MHGSPTPRDSAGEPEEAENGPETDKTAMDWRLLGRPPAGQHSACKDHAGIFQGQLFNAQARQRCRCHQGEQGQQGEVQPLPTPLEEMECQEQLLARDTEE
jgi:hypothetical protein